MDEDPEDGIDEDPSTRAAPLPATVQALPVERSQILLDVRSSFHQTTVSVEGFPVRRESTTSVAAVEAEERLSWASLVDLGSGARAACSPRWHVVGEALSFVLLACTLTQRGIGAWRWQLAASSAGLGCAIAALCLNDSGTRRPIAPKFKLTPTGRTALNASVCLWVGLTIVARVILAIELVSLVAFDKSAKCVTMHHCYWDGRVQRRSRCKCRTIDCFDAQETCVAHSEDNSCLLYGGGSQHHALALYYSRELDRGVARTAFSNQRDCYRYYSWRSSELVCVFLLVVLTCALLPCEYSTFFRCWHALRTGSTHNRAQDLLELDLAIDPTAPVAQIESPQLSSARTVDDFRRPRHRTTTEELDRLPDDDLDRQTDDDLGRQPGTPVEGRSPATASPRTTAVEKQQQQQQQEYDGDLPATV